MMSQLRLTKSSENFQESLVLLTNSHFKRLRNRCNIVRCNEKDGRIRIQRLVRRKEVTRYIGLDMMQVLEQSGSVILFLAENMWTGTPSVITNV